jgi:hypothetical protein
MVDSPVEYSAAAYSDWKTVFRLILSGNLAKSGC